MSTDSNSLNVIDVVPSEVELYTGDVDGGGPLTGPVEFLASTSGLTFNSATDVGYSAGPTKPTSFSQCNYAANGSYDATIKYICINPKGAMQAGRPAKTFTVKFRTRIK